MKNRYYNSPAFPRVAPFVAFMLFIGLEQGLRALIEHQVLPLEATALFWLYIPKAALVGLMLVMFRKHYVEIKARDLLEYRSTALSVFSGVLIFVLWINMDWTLTGQAAPAGFKPEVFSTAAAIWLMICVRVAGAVIVVPIMEELFWRSFLLRYLIDSDFTKVAIGRFSLFSFAAVSILFGLEHHYLFAGMMAGVIFNGIYYYTRSIAQCILSHAIANLCLAGYVLATGYWHFW